MRAEIQPEAPFWRSRPARVSLLLAVAMLGAGAFVGFACGGTTGSPDSPVTPGATPADDGGIDATVVSLPEASTVVPDAGLFDVDILYADQMLPDVSAPPEGGPAGYPWPNCPPWQPILVSGQPTTPTKASSWEATEYDDAGMVVVAPDGSPCATYPWYGSSYSDQCLSVSAPHVGGASAFLPPCVWCADAGLVAQGTRKQDPRYTVCLDLYACMMKSGCYVSDPIACLCGTENINDCLPDPNPPGPCATEELAALEQLPGSTAEAIPVYNTTFSGTTGTCGSELNGVFTAGAIVGGTGEFSGSCFADGGSN